MDMLKEMFTAAMNDKSTELAEAFVAMGGSVDRTGEVLVQTLRETCSSFELNIDIDKLVREVDANSDGTVDFTEFSLLLSKDHLQSHEIFDIISAGNSTVPVEVVKKQTVRIALICGAALSLTEKAVEQVVQQGLTDLTSVQFSELILKKIQPSSDSFATSSQSFGEVQTIFSTPLDLPTKAAKNAPSIKQAYETTADLQAHLDQIFTKTSFVTQATPATKGMSFSASNKRRKSRNGGKRNPSAASMLSGKFSFSESKSSSYQKSQKLNPQSSVALPEGTGPTSSPAPRSPTAMNEAMSDAGGQAIKDKRLTALTSAELPRRPSTAPAATEAKSTSKLPPVVGARAPQPLSPITAPSKTTTTSNNKGRKPNLPSTLQPSSSSGLRKEVQRKLHDSSSLETWAQEKPNKAALISPSGEEKALQGMYLQNPLKLKHDLRAQVRRSAAAIRSRVRPSGYTDPVLD